MHGHWCEQTLGVPFRLFKGSGSDCFWPRYLVRVTRSFPNYSAQLGLLESSGIRIQRVSQASTIHSGLFIFKSIDQLNAHVWSMEPKKWSIVWDFHSDQRLQSPIPFASKSSLWEIIWTCSFLLPLFILRCHPHRSLWKMWHLLKFMWRYWQQFSQKFKAEGSVIFTLQVPGPPLFNAHWTNNQGKTICFNYYTISR